MKKGTLIHHQGYGDLFTNNAICNYYSNKFDELIIFSLDEGRLKVLEYMYRHIPTIKCIVPNFISHGDTCVNCMTPGNPGGRCYRDHSVYCRYIDYNDYIDYEHIKIGCFTKNYNKWEKFLSDKINNFSFSHSFYLYAGLDLSIRTNNFSVYRDLAKELELFNSLKNKEYIVVHEDPSRGYVIKHNINTNYDIYNLNGASDLILDQISILENAKEIHFIDSSYSVLIYFLSFKNEKIKNIKKVFHSYIIPGRDIGIYENEVPKNWFKI